MSTYLPHPFLYSPLSPFSINAMAFPISVLILQCSNFIYFLTSLVSLMVMAATADKTLQSVLGSLGRNATVDEVRTKVSLLCCSQRTSHC